MHRPGFAIHVATLTRRGAFAAATAMFDLLINDCWF
jgi:hypothetical protein